MKLTLEKICLNFKLMSWKFVVPMLIAIIGSITALCVAASQGLIIAACISGASGIGFIALLMGLFLVNWFRYFKHIRCKVDGLYIIPNSSWMEIEEGNKIRLHSIIEHLCDYVHSLCNVYDVPSAPKENKKILKGTVVVFVDDFNEDDFNSKWGTNYKKIAGLYNGDAVFVEYNKSHFSLLDTALEYELGRVIMMELKEDMPLKIWHEICAKLGITKW